VEIKIIAAATAEAEKCKKQVDDDDEHNPSSLIRSLSLVS
jgi:hypothetical protein